MAVELYYGESGMNRIVAHIEGVKANVHEHAEKVAAKATASLAEAAARARPIYEHGHHDISTQQDDVDSLVVMGGPDAMAVEFGHAPSGYFAPEKYGKVTKAPQGLYILTSAAGMAGKTMVPARKEDRG